MGYVAVFETSNNVQNRVRASYVSEELIAETFALARAFHQSGDVDDFQLRRNNFRAFGYLSELE
jgi:hypothetical protein